MSTTKKETSNRIKDKKTYEALRRDGASKEKAARIANAAHNTSRSQVGKKGGTSPRYEDWSVNELKKRAQEIDIQGRSKMNKASLIHALRHH